MDNINNEKDLQNKEVSPKEEASLNDAEILANDEKILSDELSSPIQEPITAAEEPQPAKGESLSSEESSIEKNQPIIDENLQKEQELMAKLLETQQKYQRSSEEQKKIAEENKSLFSNIPENNVKKAKKYKKYVIRVNEEYKNFLDEIDKDQRNELFNQYLANEVRISGKKKFKKTLTRIIKHLLVIALTIIIGFPLLFYLINMSMKNTVENYKYMQVNFEKLYQQKKINEF